jgi:parallel beta-helix repeat protein
MRTSAFFLTAILLIICSAPLKARIINVPGDSTTIQAGINGCVDGDTVLVADGTYTGEGNCDIDFMGLAIVVMSENGPDVTIIDCEGSVGEPHRGFYFHSEEDSSSVLQGFTITNGHVSYTGGGICCVNSSPTITGNTISGNTAVRSGGGIFLQSSSPTIFKNFIYENRAGRPLEDSRADGGGIYCDESSSPFIANNIISTNRADVDARGDWAIALGGGVYCEDNRAIITNNIIIGNSLSATSLWGYEYHYCYGGGIYSSGDSLTISNNTILENHFDSGWYLYGAGIYAVGGTLTNNIVRDNDYDDDWQIEGGATVMYSNVEGGYPGEGNIDADPLFVTFHGFDYLLHPDSPCIDTGDPSIEDGISDWHPKWPEKHIDGPRSDMGAYGGPWNINWVQ